MNYILSSSNNENEVLKNVGPYRIHSTDSSLFILGDAKEVYINTPIVIQAEELQKTIIIEEAEDLISKEWLNPFE